MKNKKSLFAIATFLIALGCAGVVSINSLSALKRPKVKPSLMMGRHMKRGIDCLHCHPNADKKARASTVGRKVCMECHESLVDPRLARKFVPGGILFDEDGIARQKSITTIDARIVFSHKVHTEKKVKCAECHGDIENDNYSLVSVAPLYKNCERCHRREEAAGKCDACHKSLNPGSLPHTHDDTWSPRHGIYVRHLGSIDEVDTSCASCHKQDFCISCHNNTAPQDHNSFFRRTGHGIDATNDRERCAVCHTEDRCVSCHTTGATPAPPDHAGYSVANCDACHTNIESHVVMATRCFMCHR